MRNLECAISVSHSDSIAKTGMLTSEKRQSLLKQKEVSANGKGCQSYY
jgi:hypothetical protein